MKDITGALQWVGSGSFWVTLALIVLMVLLIWFYRKNRKFKQHFKLEGGENAEVGAKLYQRSGGSSYEVMLNIGTWLIISVFVLIILSVNGVNVTAPLAGLGIVGTIVGLACQDVMKDTIMGLRIVHDEFYLVGDAVRINDIDGVVIDFNLRHTKLENLKDHSVLCICNGQITSVKRLSNLLIVEIPFSDTVPLQKVKTAIQHMCSRIWMLDGIQNCYYKGLDSVDISAAHYHLWVYTKAENQEELGYKVWTIVKEVMEEEELGMPVTTVKLNN